MEVLGYRIREAREAAGLTQEALARAAGLNLRSIQNWEHEIHQPRLENLAKIAEATGKPLDFFLLPRTTDLGTIVAIEKAGMSFARTARRMRRGISA